MRNQIHIAMALIALAIPLSTWAQKPSAYPAKGQDAQQTASDDAQCLAWAKQDTGIDPMAVAAAPPPATGPQGERLRGAARGAPSTPATPARRPAAAPRRRAGR